MQIETLEARIVFAASPCAGYQSYESISQELAGLAASYPTYAKVESIGKSSAGKDLWVMHISDNVSTDEAAEPAVFYTGGMHGNEPDGAALSMYLVKELLNSSNSNIRSIVDSTDIYIMPVMNPDGYAACSRSNRLGYNLNRSFTDYSSDATQSNNQLTVPLNTTSIDATAPEAAAVMKFSKGHNFVLAADLHANGGTAVVNYPYDQTTGVASGAYAKSPDDDLFKYISKVYSSREPQMWDAGSRNGQFGVPYIGANGKKLSALTVNTTFPQGITNGSDWFAAGGTLQDWHYRYMGTNAVTVEFRGVANYATSDELWLANKNSMLAYLQTAHVGVSGKVVNAAGVPVQASVVVEGIGTNPATNVAKHYVFSNISDGELVRMLPPATYSSLNVTVSAPGYDTYTRTFTNVAVGSTVSSTVPPPSSVAALPSLIRLGEFVLTASSGGPTSLASQADGAPVITSPATTPLSIVARQPSTMQEAQIPASPVPTTNSWTLDANSKAHAQAVDIVFAESILENTTRKTPTLRTGVSPVKLRLASIS